MAKEISINYTVKEMIQQLHEKVVEVHTKVDAIDAKLNCHVPKEECTRVMEQQRNMALGLFTFSMSVLGSFLAWFFFK